MTRTTPSDVKETFDTELPDSAVSDWIARATILVDRIADADSTVDSATLTEIETLVAQHYVSTQDPRVEKSKSGDTSHTYARSSYWAAAKTLDPTNVLAGSEKPNASISVPDGKGIK